MGVHEVSPTVTRARGPCRGLWRPLWRGVQHARDARAPRARDVLPFRDRRPRSGWLPRGDGGQRARGVRQP